MSRSFFLWLCIALLFRPGVSAAERADRILVEKKDRKLTLYSGDKPIREYKIALGFEPVGPKRQQGDGKTPEGSYKILGRNRASRFHRSLRISYPNEADRRQARARGVDPGGDIMIHGLPNGMGSIGSAHRLRDWTLGCIAVTSDEIEEIWELVPDGAGVEITP